MHMTFDLSSIAGLAVFLIILLFSVILHEIAHGTVAEWFGDTTAKDAGRLTLNPLVHIDPVFSIIVPLVLYITTGFPFGAAKPVPVNYNRLSNFRWGVFCVSIAGIITNLFLAFAFSIPLHFSALNQSFASFCALVIEINISLAVVNMIPIPPIDGSKAIAALLGEWAIEKVTSFERRGIWGLLPFLILIYFLFTTSFFNGVLNPVLGFFYHVFGLG